MADDRRPKDMTDAELAALPVGPFHIVKTSRPIIQADYDKGARGARITRAEMPRILATYIEPDDLLRWVDDAGQPFSFGRFGDGSWYKQPEIF